MHHYVDEAVEAQDLSEMERLGVDDTSFRRGQSYVSVFCDLDPSERRAVFVCERRDQQTVEQFAGFLAGHGGDPERISEVCQDMSQAYLAGVRENLKRAEVTFDRYHVKQKLSEAINTVRRAEAKERPLKARCPMHPVSATATIASTPRRGGLTWQRSLSAPRRTRVRSLAFVICDYVRKHGQHRLAAINFVEGAVKLGPAAFGALIGPGFLDHFADLTADDLAANIRGVRAFVRVCAATPPATEELKTALCWNMALPAHIRANLAAREIDDATCCARSRSPCSSRRAGRTPSCCPRWPSTSSPRARPPRPPGPTASATCSTWSSRRGSIASWPSSPGAPVADRCARVHFAPWGTTGWRPRLRSSSSVSSAVSPVGAVKRHLPPPVRNADAPFG